MIKLYCSYFTWFIILSYMYEKKKWMQKWYWFLVGCSTLVGQCPLKSLSAVFLSVRLFICPPVTKVSEDWIIIFSDIVHDDNWPWYLVTEKARFLEKKKKKEEKWWSDFESNGPKSDTKWGFLPFSCVWNISFSWNCIRW